MPEQVHAFDELATRDGFNRSLRHFKFISRVIADFESRINIADILSGSLADKSIEPRQVLPTLNAILVDKYHYSCRSHNLAEGFDAFDGLAATVVGVAIERARLSRQVVEIAPAQYQIDPAP